MFVRSFFRVSQVSDPDGARRHGSPARCRRSALCGSDSAAARRSRRSSVAAPRAPHPARRCRVPLPGAARLATSSATLLVGHIVIATPYVIRCVTAGLVGMDPRWKRRRWSGSHQLQAFLKVTLPLLPIEPGERAGVRFIVSFMRHQPCALPRRPERTQPARAHLSQIQFEADRRSPRVGAASRDRRRAHLLSTAAVPSSADGLTNEDIDQVWQSTASCAEPRDRAHGQAPGPQKLTRRPNGACGASAHHELWRAEAGMSRGFGVPVGRRSQCGTRGECYTRRELLGGSRSGLLLGASGHEAKA